MARRMSTRDADRKIERALRPGRKEATRPVGSLRDGREPSRPYRAPKGYSEPAQRAAAKRAAARHTNTDFARLKVENILLQIACAELNVDRLKAMLATYPKTFVSEVGRKLLNTVNSR